MIVRKTFFLPLLLAAPALSISLAGCRSTPDTASESVRPDTNRLNDARSDLNQIPPPSKNLYMSVGTMNEWQNPSITVQEKMITAARSDARMPIPLTWARGTMLRPEAARRQTAEYRTPDQLAVRAHGSIPKEAWPYGRVIAIEEAHDAPQDGAPAATPQHRGQPWT